MQNDEESIRTFLEASLDNCRASIREGGVSRFDLLQDIDNPSHFQLIEVYVRDEDYYYILYMLSYLVVH